MRSSARCWRSDSGLSAPFCPLATLCVPFEHDTDTTRSFRALIPPKIASPSSITGSVTAQRMTRVVEFYSKVRRSCACQLTPQLPKGAAPAKRTSLNPIRAYSQRYFDGENASVTPIIHVLLFGLGLGYALNCAFGRSTLLTHADSHICPSTAHLFSRTQTTRRTRPRMVTTSCTRRCASYSEGQNFTSRASSSSKSTRSAIVELGLRRSPSNSIEALRLCSSLP